MSLTTLVLPLSLLAPGDPAQPRPFPGPGFSWGDIDGDGRLDALVLPPGGAPRLLRNDGAAGLVDVTPSSGLDGAPPADGSLWADLDADGDLDLVLARRSGESTLFRNDGGTLARLGAETGLELGGGVRHIELVDVDGKAPADLFVAGVDEERVYRNLGGLAFEAVPIDLPVRGALADGAQSGYSAGGTATSGAAGICLDAITDQATGSCLPASSAPLLGALYPLGPELNIDGAGRVGIGTLSPSFRLDVAGDLRASGQIVSSAASGAPLVVGSADLVENLNADRLDGLDASAFSQLGSSIELGELAANSVDGGKVVNGSIGAADLAPGSVGSEEIADLSITGADVASFTISGSKIGSGAVSSSKLADGAVTTEKIAPKAVGTSEIAVNAVTWVELATSAVQTMHILDGTVQSSDIGDGEIVDADVGAAAAIAGTKIAPDFGAQDVVTTGRVGAGTSTPDVDLHVVGSSTFGRAMIAPQQFQSGDDSELLLAEDEDGTFGMKLAYDGGVNELRIQGSVSGTDTDHVRVTRDGGDVMVNTDSVRGKLTVIGEGQIGTEAIYGFAAQGAIVAECDTGNAVWAKAYDLSALNYGLRGITNSSNGYGVFSNGDMGTTGAKAFVQPDPSDPGREIRFYALEGNESGTYFRGRSRLTGGVAVIEVPEEFRLASEPGDLGVQVTPRGPALVWVESESLEEIVVRGSDDVEFSYLVHGVRRGWKDAPVFRENTSFVPEERGVPYGTQYPDAYRRILVENGILNPDFTPDEDVAAKMGWELADPGPPAPAPVPVD